MQHRLPILACAIALGLAGLASVADAQTWTAIGTDSDHTAYSVDVSSISGSGNARSAWVQEIPTSKKWMASQSFWYSSELVRFEFDCENEDIFPQAETYRDEAGAILSNQAHVAAPTSFYPVPPGTIGNMLLKYVCNGSTSPSISPSTQRLMPFGPETQIDWTQVASNDSAVDYVTKAGIDDEGKGVILFYNKETYSTPQANGGDAPYSVGYYISAINCLSKTYLIMVEDLYGLSGNYISSKKISSDQVHPTPIVPNSFADAERQAVCPGSNAIASVPQEPVPAPAISSGTAWLGPGGYLITADHVVDGATSLALAQGGKYIGTAELVLADPANDIAVLKPAFIDGVHPSIAIRSVPPKLGERIFTLGYPAPDQLGLSVKVTSGEISALTGQDAVTHRIDDARLMQVSAPVQPGNSGGPVMDANGEAIGIVISRLQLTSSSELAQNVNYALKIGYVQALLAGLPALSPDRPVQPTSSMVDAIAQLQRGVFLIVASGSAGH